MTAQSDTVQDSAPNLDDTDKWLLNRLQFDFPIAECPWAILAHESGDTQSDVLSRIIALKDRRLIRQISPIFDTRALGYSSTLAAARVQNKRLEDAAAAVSRHPGVSHNYERQAEFNLWFTLAVPPGASLGDELSQLAADAAFDDYIALPTIRTYRIGVMLDVADGGATPQRKHAARPKHGSSAPVTLTDRDKEIIRVTQNDLPLVEYPFADMCDALGITFDELAAWFDRMQQAGAMRRFAAILRHREAGFTANGMVVWQLPDDTVDKAGEIAAAAPEVTHCYRRPTFDAWPYNLYTMVHATSESQCQAVVDRLYDQLKPLGAPAPRTLLSTREFKKERVRYFE